MRQKMKRTKLHNLPLFEQYIIMWLFWGCKSIKKSMFKKAER